MPSGDVFRGSAPLAAGAYGVNNLRGALQLNQLKVCSLGRPSEVRERTVHRLNFAPIMSFYCVWGARFRRIPPRDSIATFASCEPAPHVCAAINNKDVPSGGTASPRAKISPSADTFGGRRRFRTLKIPCQKWIEAVRQTSTAQGHAADASLEMGRGSRRNLPSSITDSQEWRVPGPMRALHLYGSPRLVSQVPKVATSTTATRESNAAV